MKDQQPAAAPVLPWMRLPISIPNGSGVPLDEVCGLYSALKEAVHLRLGFQELFPVQAAVWRGLAGGLSPTHDMCICAPTGSGKTLAYALPVINAIAVRRAPRCNILTGLVVLPTRDLAVQVHSVLQTLGQAAGLIVALAAAQESVAAEAAKLVATASKPGTGPDLLVATPGRLMAHLQATAGFSIRGVRFLVVDEADRLLRQDYQGWLPEVLQQLHYDDSNNTQMQPLSAWQQQQRSEQAGAGLPQLDISSSNMLLPYSTSSSNRVLKLIVSATLTADPSKLLRLLLHNPRYITLTGVHHRYVLPTGLQQYRLVVPAQHKPLALLGLLQSLAGSTSLVFASSLETTHRLYLMLAAVPGLPESAAEYSSNIPADRRAAILAAFRSGSVKVLVTSDAMARGMDVPSVANVVNYDPPVYPKMYVHRAGRTARAGHDGSVYTLLKPEDVVHFNGMVRKLEGSGVKQFKLTPQQLQPLRPALKEALQEVQQLLQQEKQVQQRHNADGRRRREQQKVKQPGGNEKQQQQRQHKVAAHKDNDSRRMPESPAPKKAKHKK